MDILRKLGALCCLCWALAASGVAAQTINQPLSPNWIGGSNIGQSFQATLTGHVVAISVGSGTTRGANLYIYNGALGSGTPGSLGAPIYTQAVTLNAAALGVLQRIDLTTPFPVTAGSSYSFVLSGPSSLSGSVVNRYSNGELLSTFAQPVNNWDLAFQVFEMPPGSNAAAIPSSSAWALIGAALLIMAAAVLMRRRAVNAWRT